MLKTLARAPLCQQNNLKSPTIYDLTSSHSPASTFDFLPRFLDSSDTELIVIPQAVCCFLPPCSGSAEAAGMASLAPPQPGCPWAVLEGCQTPYPEFSSCPLLIHFSSALWIIIFLFASTVSLGLLLGSAVTHSVSDSNGQLAFLGRAVMICCACMYSKIEILLLLLSWRCSLRHFTSK